MAALLTTTIGIDLPTENLQLQLTRALLEYLNDYSVSDRDVSYELGNIVERFLVAMANQVNSDVFRKQNPDVIVKSARIYRKIDFSDPLVAKMLEEMKNKEIFQQDNIRDKVVTQVINFINYTLENTKINASTISFEKKNGDNYIFYARKTLYEAFYKMTQRTQLIRQMSNDSTLIAIMMRYEALNSRGQQWGLSQKHYDYMYNTYNVRNEGFSSVLNSRLLGKTDARFYSLFEDLEGGLGSGGDFFNVSMEEINNNWILNPPFIESIMAQAAKKVVITLEEQKKKNRGKSMTVFFIIPAWRDSDAYKTLSMSSFKRTQLDLSKNTYYYENVDGEVIPANFDSVYFALSTEKTELYDLSIGIVNTSSVNDVLTIPTVSDISQTTMTAVPTLSTATVIMKDPQQNISVVNTTTQTNNSWLKELKKYLRQLLSKRATSDMLVVDNLLDTRFDKIWIRCFTHQSYNRNKTENYETLETLGDKVLDTTFYDYLFARYPMIEESDASLLRNQYLGKKEQAPVSSKLGLPEYLRRVYPLTKSMQEDVFEAFMGALFNVGDLALGRGSGYSLCKLFISPIYDELKISPEIAIKDPITQVKEILEKLKFVEGKKIRTIEISDGNPNDGYEMRLQWPPRAYDFFEQNNINMTMEIFGVGQGNTETEARAFAYVSGLTNLNKMGIDMDYADQYSKRLKINGPNEDLYKQANALAYQQGYSNGVDFPREQFVKGEERAVQLVGSFIANDGNVYRKILATVIGSPNDIFPDLQKKALLQYITSGS